MDAIDTFLQAMFAPYPATPRMTEAKAELRAMMEDAYADALSSGKTHNEAVGQVITDFGNLEELAPVLGILPEIRGAQADGGPSPLQGSTPTQAGMTGAAGALAVDGYPVVTLPEAQQLAEARRRTGRLLGQGVALCVLAAVPLALSDSVSLLGLPLSEDQAVTLGATLTLVIVAWAVSLLIRRNQAFAGVRHLLQGRFTQDPIVSAWAARLRVEHEGPRSRALTIAVSLWIVSAVPAMGTGILSDGKDTDYSGLGFALTLMLVALGLLVLLPHTWASSTHSTLTEEGRRPNGGSSGKANSLIGVVAAVYWPLVTAGYLCWSFLTDAWDRSWVVWPVAGLAFGALSAGIGAWEEYRNKHPRS